MADAKAELQDALDRALELLRTAHGADDLSEPFDSLADALTKWCRETPRAVYMRGVDGAPDWDVCEFRSWEMGEAVRKASAGARPRRLLRERPVILERFVGLQELGKGRGSWATAAIAIGGADSAERLAISHLHDPGVTGEIFKGLARWRISGFEKMATRLAVDAETRFARNQAKRYLRAVSES